MDEFDTDTPALSGFVSASDAMRPLSRDLIADDQAANWVATSAYFRTPGHPDVLDKWDPTIGQVCRAQ